MNIKYNTVLGLVVVVQQNSSNALLLRNIQLTEENSLPGIFMTLIVRMPDLKLFFGFRFISINTVIGNANKNRPFPGSSKLQVSVSILEDHRLE